MKILKNIFKKDLAVMGCIILKNWSVLIKNDLINWGTVTDLAKEMQQEFVVN